MHACAHGMHNQRTTATHSNRPDRASPLLACSLPSRLHIDQSQKAVDCVVAWTEEEIALDQYGEVKVFCFSRWTRFWKDWGKRISTVQQFDCAGKNLSRLIRFFFLPFDHSVGWRATMLSRKYRTTEMATFVSSRLTFPFGGLQLVPWKSW